MNVFLKHYPVNVAAGFYYISLDADELWGLIWDKDIVVIRYRERFRCFEKTPEGRSSDWCSNAVKALENMNGKKKPGPKI